MNQIVTDFLEMLSIDLSVALAVFILLGIIVGNLITIYIIQKRSLRIGHFEFMFGIGLILFFLTWAFLPNQLSYVNVLATFVVALLTFRSIDEMKLARVQENRPVMILDFDVPYGQHLIMLVLKNEGKSLAKNVSCTIKPELIDSRGRNISKSPLFSKPIETFAAGKEIRQIFDGFVQYLGDKNTFPLTFEVIMQYADMEGNQYQENMTMDLSIYKEIQFTINRPYKNMEDEMKNLRRVVERGIIVQTKEDYEKEMQLRDEELKKEFKRKRKEQENRNK